MPGAVEATFVAAHDSDRFETDLCVAADGGGVVGCGVDHEPVMAAIHDEVPGKRAHGVGAESVAVHSGIDVDVDAGMEVVGLRFSLPLDRADDFVFVLDDLGLDVGLGKVVGYRLRHVLATTPPSMHLFGGPDSRQLWHIRLGGRTQRHLRALQSRHRGLPCALCGSLRWQPPSG